MKLFKWTGTFSTIVGSIWMATIPSSALLVWPWVLYIIGATIWMVAATIHKDSALFTLNLAFFIINSVAIFTRILT